ncbi:YceI family protein [Rhodococcoides corynebacterioides]|uniref:YceI family protein n=1 Tax=Rhodococcoides corynebacterioides TaxID=53972 RepID=UPI003F7CDE9D
MTDTRTLRASDDNVLEVRTGVTGKASSMGHRLTLVMREWTATVSEKAGELVGVDVTVDVDSLTVTHGEGGVTPMFGPEKAMARSNALKKLHSKDFPTIRYVTTEVTGTDEGYRLTGTLTVHGTERPHTVDLRVARVEERWRASFETTVAQTDFGIEPYSQMFGAMKVVDDVVVTFDAGL